MPLDTTPGGASANSYASLAEANAYFLNHVYADTWNAAEPTTREAAMIMAARLLDGMPRAWTGSAASSTQALTWPRSGMLSRNGFEIGSAAIPGELKNAQAELAGQLLVSNRTEDNETLLKGITGIVAGPVEVEFQEVDQKYMALKRKESLEAMIPDAVIMLLVPSWLLDPRDQDAAYSGFLFETV